MVALALFACVVRAAPPADLDAYAQNVLKTFATPGMASRDRRAREPAVVRSTDPAPGPVRQSRCRTLFPIGSTSKAFTAAVLATLVDEGKLTWDTKVADVLPGFRMHDAYVSSEMTVRDLLVHHSGLGLGAGDLMFYPPTDLSRADIVRRLRYIKPTSSFRSTFAYSNLMYVVAGEVIQAVSGQPWEVAVRQRILDPLGMRATTTSVPPSGADFAWPHARTTTDMRGDGPIVALGAPTNLDNAAAAGALNTNGAEIARWLELQVGRGLDPQTGKRVFSETQARALWTPQTLVPVAPSPQGLELAQSHYRAYALGWTVSDYRGEQVLSHGGGVPGTVVLLCIVPGKDLAFAVFVNSEEGSALSAMQYKLLDHYLGVQSPDWPTALETARRERVAGGRKALAADREEQAQLAGGAGHGPSLPLDRYAGRYRDDWYGESTIEQTPAGLAIKFQHTPALAGPLEHVRYDTFVAHWADRSLEDAYVTFALDANGHVERMTMRPVSPLADFSFDFQDLLFRPVP